MADDITYDILITSVTTEGSCVLVFAIHVFSVHNTPFVQSICWVTYKMRKRYSNKHLGMNESSRAGQSHVLTAPLTVRVVCATLQMACSYIQDHFYKRDT